MRAGLPVLFICLVITVLTQSNGTGWGQLEQLRKPRALPEPQPLPEVPMVVISEGFFAMGANGTDALEDERPQHQVWVDRFEMDRYEVTTGHYAKFLAETNRPAPWQWEAVEWAQHQDRPVISSLAWRVLVGFTEVPSYLRPVQTVSGDSEQLHGVSMCQDGRSTHSTVSWAPAAHQLTASRSCPLNRRSKTGSC